MRELRLREVIGGAERAVYLGLLIPMAFKTVPKISLEMLEIIFSHS